MILALNTAQHIHEMAILDESNDCQVLLEKRWRDERDAMERLIPTLDSMLGELGLDKKSIQHILCVNGPGPFTSVRAGVSFANALAEALGASLHPISTIELMQRKAATQLPLLVLLYAGGLNIACIHEHEMKLGPIASLLAELPHKTFTVIPELNDTLSKELHSIALEKEWTVLSADQIQSLAEVIRTEGLAAFPAVETIEVNYLKAPKITASKNPWKSPNPDA